jgi:hypothetical protein
MPPRIYLHAESIRNLLALGVREGLNNVRKILIRMGSNIEELIILEA